MNSLEAYLKSAVNMQPEDLNMLQAMSNVKHVHKNLHLLKQGMVCKHIYFILQGWLRMYFNDPDGNEINRRFTFENNFAVDFQSFITQQPSIYYLQAMQDAEVVSISYEYLQVAYEKSKAWERLGRLLAEKGYQHLNERIELMQFYTPEERYRYILDKRPELFERVPLFHLSSYLGIRPESLSRLRKRIVNTKT